MSKKLLSKLLVSALFLITLFVSVTITTSTAKIDETTSVHPENHDKKPSNKFKENEKLNIFSVRYL